MNAQLELTYRNAVRRAKSGPSLARRMIAVLVVARGWVTRAEFTTLHGFSADGRECRLGRAASHGRIIHGNKGFKLMAYATADERAESLRNWENQIKASQREYSMEIRRGHAMVSGGSEAGMETLCKNS